MLSLFFCYAAEDQNFCEELEKQLALMKRQGLLESWSSLSILAGKYVQEELERMIAQAQIALLLVSPDFLAIDELYEKQLVALMERQRTGALYVIPVLVRPVEGWKTSLFGHLKSAPRGERPIALWKNRDEAYAEVVAEVRRVIEGMDRARPPEQLASEPGASTVSADEEPVSVDLILKAERSTIANVDQGSDALSGKVSLSITASDSKVADIEQDIGEVTGNITTSINASEGSSITVVKQRVNKGRSAK